MKKLLLFFVIAVSQFCYSQSDCVTAIPICGNSNQYYTPSGSGNVQEILETNGCLASNERFTVWYSFTIATSGTLSFTIIPNVAATDYDFAVYGPTANGCTSLQTNNVFVAPIRCNYSGTTGNTGLDLNLPPSSPNNNQWSPYMQVTAGETYYLVIDNFSRTTNGFSLTWGGTATLSSAFTDPTLAPNPFITPGIPNPNGVGPNLVSTCPLPGLFDFTTLTRGIINNNANFVVSYHLTANDALTGNNPITTPIMVNGNDTYYYSIHYQDPNNPNNPLNSCRQTGNFKFILGVITPQNSTLYACNNNGQGTATFNLTSANVYPAEPTATKKYYLTLNDLNADINEITNPLNYVSAEKTIYVKVINSGNCAGIGEIYLKFHPEVKLYENTIKSCFIEGNITYAVFDLTTANVTSQTGNTFKYYKTLAEALAETNPIVNANTYTSQDGFVYVRATNEKGCFAITKITLKVTAPIKSSVLKDKVICFESRTTLDAGPGFDGYEWNTGAKTQAIQGVAVGTYWVKLKTGSCTTYQEVNVYATQQPVISSIDITNNTITINANGGTQPYQYSLDGITWQNSNVFTGVPRGENKVYLKDTNNCTPIMVQITVPNLLNAITPNGDNINDEIDYTALAYKNNLVFTVYDRYGNKLYEANKLRNYKWNGTAGNKKIKTGTYWYTITWNENDKNNTPTKYSGWILVKNRD